MRIILPLSVLTLFSFLGISSLAQNTRISDRNTIGWYNYFGTFRLNEKFGIHTEYQFRRDNLITDWQQSLLRVGVNYQIHQRIQLRLGYAWIETWPYGDIPINVFGKDFTEHRTYQMLTISDKIGVTDLSHRFMLEQRWVGRYSDENLTREDQFVFTNRMRYMFRFLIPLKVLAFDNRIPYITAYDEIFIGFGKNVNENVFDQNRIGVLFGFNFNSLFRMEAGYLNQIVQLGREVEGRNVFQYNNGLIVNTFFNFHTSKRYKSK